MQTQLIKLVAGEAPPGEAPEFAGQLSRSDAGTVAEFLIGFRQPDPRDE